MMKKRKIAFINKMLYEKVNIIVKYELKLRIVLSILINFKLRRRSWSYWVWQKLSLFYYYDVFF